jgi:hypothetical protein
LFGTVSRVKYADPYCPGLVKLKIAIYRLLINILTISNIAQATIPKHPIVNKKGIAIIFKIIVTNLI